MPLFACTVHRSYAGVESDAKHSHTSGGVDLDRQQILIDSRNVLDS